MVIIIDDGNYQKDDGNYHKDDGTYLKKIMVIIIKIFW